MNKNCDCVGDCIGSKDCIEGNKCKCDDKKETIKATPVTPSIKIGRNWLCPCGSGKKYKFCCLNKR
jgi:uncharacterized protein YecA (UPF0149 family)